MPSFIHRLKICVKIVAKIDFEFNKLGLYIDAIGNPERHVRKASHRGSKQQ